MSEDGHSATVWAPGQTVVGIPRKAAASRDAGMGFGT